MDLTLVAKAVAAFRSLEDAWADTIALHGRLVLTVLGGLAECEGEIIPVRTGEGRARAKAWGHSLGRKHMLTPFQKAEVRARKEAGDSVREIAGSNNVSLATVSRLQISSQEMLPQMRTITRLSGE